MRHLKKKKKKDFEEQLPKGIEMTNKNVLRYLRNRKCVRKSMGWKMIKV